MKNERPGTRVPFDEEKLQRVREFLRLEFQGCPHRDYFEFDKTAQVFLIGPDRNVRHTLVIPKGTFEDADFVLLLNQQLVAALKLAGARRVTLTPQAPRAIAGERRQIQRFLKWRRATNRAGATLVRHSLVYGAAMLLLGIGSCALVSSLAWKVRDPRQRVFEWRLVPEERNARLEERPATAALRTASTGRPAPRPQGRRDRNLSSSVAASVAHDPIKKTQVDPVDTLRRLVGHIPEAQPGKAIVRWVKTQPPPDSRAQRREPATPQSR